ncbi:MAG: bacteriohemerythrin [Phaeospirillum sp.]|nr:bacteriohemerythrin [Phaeospirillum sp.]
MLAWRDAMSVGHHEIDNAHKHFIKRINAFEKALASDGERVAIGLFLTGLYEEATINFGREDKVQRECNYPFHEAHAREHAALLATVEKLQGRFAALGENGSHDPLLHEVSALIKEWITIHIVQSDTRVKPYWLRKNNIFTKSSRG